MPWYEQRRQWKSCHRWSGCRSHTAANLPLWVCRCEMWWGGGRRGGRLNRPVMIRGVMARRTHYSHNELTRRPSDRGAFVICGWDLGPDDGVFEACAPFIRHSQTDRVSNVGNLMSLMSLMLEISTWKVIVFGKKLNWNCDDFALYSLS